MKKCIHSEKYLAVDIICKNICAVKPEMDCCENCSDFQSCSVRCDFAEENNDDCKLGPHCSCDDCREYTENFNPKI